MIEISREIETRQEALDWFLAEHFPEPATPERPARPSPVVPPRPGHDRPLSDDEILTKARDAGNGAKFTRLFNGDCSGYLSQSEADQALCNMLAFWCRCDAEQMDRLFLLSGMANREKAGRADYRARTIGKAIAGCREVYSGGGKVRGYGATRGAFAGFRDHRQDQSDRMGEWAGKSYAEAQPAAIDPAAMLERFEVQREYVEKLGQEEFLIENLLIRQHILVVIAMSGGGKTAIFFRYVAPVLARKGMTVWYLDADSPASEHKAMKEIADKHGFRFLNADANLGAGIDELKKTLEDIATRDCDLAGHVFIFDTLKKFINMMSKDSAKAFFALCRKLTSKGGTVALLGHANKRRSKPEGHLEFEGVGDVRNDVDEMIMFERRKNENGGLDITTDPDPDHGAKVRGIFEPLSFHIGSDREVTVYEKPVEMPDNTLTATPTATEEEILDAAAEFLAEAGEPVSQSALVNQVRAMTGAAHNRVRGLIVANSMKAGSEGHKRVVYTIGARGRLDYSLPQGGPEQGKLFEDEPGFQRESSFMD